MKSNLIIHYIGISILRLVQFSFNFVTINSESAGRYETSNKYLDTVHYLRYVIYYIDLIKIETFAKSYGKVVLWYAYYFFLSRQCLRTQ